MDARVYWGPEYFYAVAVDGDYEYMPYEEYLLIKDRVPGYAVIFKNPPVIINGKIHSFEVEAIEIKSVEKLGQNLFKITKEDGKIIITDGSIAVDVKESLLNFLKKTIGFEGLKILTGYDYTNASMILSKEKELIIVYQDLYLRVDPKTLEFKNDGKQHTIVEIIDFSTNPTTGKIYEILENGDYVYHGRKYVYGVPIFDYRVSGSGKIKIDSKIDLSFTRLVRVKEGKVELVKKMGPLFGYWPGSLLRKNTEIKEREGTVFIMDRVYSEEIKAIMTRNGKVYYVSAPRNAYVYGRTEFLLKNFGRELPLTYRGGKLYVDFSKIKPASNRKNGGHRTIKIGKNTFTDYGYMLYNEEDGFVCPLIKLDLISRKRTFLVPLKENVENDDDRKMYGGFFVSKHSVYYDGIGTQMYSLNSIEYSNVAVINGWIVPGKKHILRFIEEYSEYVREVYYYPDRDGYRVLIDLGEFFLSFGNYLNRAVEIIFPELKLAMKVNWRSGWLIESVNFDAETVGSYIYCSPGVYYEVEVDESGLVEKRFRKVKYDQSTPIKIPIYYPLRNPSIVYHDYRIYLGIGRKKVIQLDEVYLPDAYKVTGISKNGDYYELTVVHGERGEKYHVRKYSDGYFVLEFDGEEYEFDDWQGLYTALEVIDIYGKNGYRTLV